MNVKPKRYLAYGDGDDRLMMIDGDLLGIECEVISPPSAVGRTVYVFLDDDDVTMLLKECRDAASRHRTDPDHKLVRWVDLLPRKKSLLEMAQEAEDRLKEQGGE